MDPETTLTEARERAEAIMRALDACADGATMNIEDAAYLAERFQALDGWLKRGGFAPKSWRGGVRRIDEDLPLQD